MILSMNDKWRDGSITTKVSTVSMALAALFILICSILFFALGKETGTNMGIIGVLYLAAFLYTTILAFGLYKVNNIARLAVIYGGLCILLPYVLLLVLAIFAFIKVPLLKTLLSGYWSLLKGIIPTIMSLVPGDKKALGAFLMIVFIGPFILNVFSMLLLFIFRADFKSKEGPKSKLVAYLLWLFLGFFSAHKFYLEKDTTAFVFFFTFQILTFGWWANLFTLGKQVDAFNAKLAQRA